MSTLKLLRLPRSIVVLSLMLMSLALAPRSQADSPDPAMYGAWKVTSAASPADVGLRFYFSPDGVFLLVDPVRQTGAAGTYTVGRAGLMINLYNYGRSSNFITGQVEVQGDAMVIDVKNSGVISPQRTVLRRMVLQ